MTRVVGLFGSTSSSQLAKPVTLSLSLQFNLIPYLFLLSLSRRLRSDHRPRIRGYRASIPSETPGGGALGVSSRSDTQSPCSVRIPASPSRRGTDGDDYLSTSSFSSYHSLSPYHSERNDAQRTQHAIIDDFGASITYTTSLPSHSNFRSHTSIYTRNLTSSSPHNSSNIVRHESHLYGLFIRLFTILNTLNRRILT
jgi:hypothetical protein